MEKKLECCLNTSFIFYFLKNKKNNSNFYIKWRNLFCKNNSKQKQLNTTNLN